MDIKSDWYLLNDDAKAIVSLRERIENLLAIATRTTRGFEATGSRKMGGTKDKNADIVLKIMALEDELSEINYKYGLSRSMLVVNIALLIPREKRKVFVDRYVRNMSLTETAKANGITKMTVCRILKKFSKNT